MSRLTTIMLLLLVLPCALLAAPAISPVMPGAFYDGSCTMAPLFVVSVWMGAYADYNIDTGAITLYSPEHKVSMKIGSANAICDGKAQVFPSAIMLKNNIIFAPAKAIATTLGGEQVLPGSPNSLTISNPTTKEKLRLFLAGRATQAQALFTAVMADRALDVQITLNVDPELALATDIENNTLLHVAAINNNRNSPDPLLISDCTSKLPEVLTNSLTIAKLLLEKGVSPNAHNRAGVTPFATAAGKGLTPFHLLLMENGADVNTTFTGGFTQLMYAVMQDNLPIVQYLLAHGAALDLKNKDDFYALHYALSPDSTDMKVVNALLDAGADPNIVDGNGWRALDRAAWFGLEDVVVALLAHNADPNSAMRLEKLTPLHSAIIVRGDASRTLKGDGLTMARELVAKGAKVNVKNYQGDTPLHFATRQGWAAAVDFLIASGADVNVRNENNETPLRIAVEWKYLVIADVLAKKGAKQ